jgi:hypothetical protein
MKEIKLQIPDISDVKRWMKILSFKLRGGFTCTKCGSKTKFNRVKFDSAVHGKQFIFENSTPGICAACTRDEINEKADIVFTEDNCTCDWCGDKASTMSFPRHEDLESTITFGSNYWNGHHICQVCLNQAFDARKPIHSGIQKFKGGHSYCKNELGLWIKVS